MEVTMWFPDDKVQVSLPYGEDGKTVHTGTVTRVQEPGPELPWRCVQVKFDDPAIYGGMGIAWVDPLTLSALGETPAEPDRGRHES
jgi:hypothetical protein